MAIYKTAGVCATDIIFQVEDNKLIQVEFIGGCPGNLNAITKLIIGMPVSEVIEKFSGLRCGDNETSCADQLAIALRNFVLTNNKQ